MNRALVVGCSGYEDPGIAPLRFAHRDADRVGQLLRAGCDVPEDGLVLLHDGLPEPHRRPTRTNLLRHLTRLARTADEGILYFFFSGHGFQTASGEHYLLPMDCVRDAIEETALRFESVVRYLGSAGAPHLVLMLDACRNVIEGGKSAGGGLTAVDVDALCPPGVVTFCSCRPGHVSYEAERLESGVFTAAVCEALSDEGRCRTVYELNRYLERRVPEIATREGKPDQRPHARVEPLGVQHLQIISERTGHAWGTSVHIGAERRNRTVPRLSIVDPDPVVGIDVGTSYSIVSYCRPDGTVELLPGPDGRPLVPSVVHFLPDLDYLVGAAAVEADHYRPAATVRHAKRDLGSGRGYEIEGRSLTPELVTSLLLRSLKRNAEEALGTPVRRCVASRPANFTHRQNEELDRAFALAGLDVMRMLGEPNVAPLALDPDGEQIVLVVDLGGGTFDMALVELAEGVCEVKAAAGSNQVGGLDFDRATVAFAERQLRTGHGWTGDLPPTVAAVLRREAERAKRELGGRESATLLLQDLDYGDRGLRDVSIELTRADFRAATAELTAVVRATLRRPFAAAELTISRWLAEGATIFLAGQGGKIFTVREQLDDLFPGARVVGAYQETAVAHGLGSQAGVLVGRIRERLLLDVVAFGVGISAQRVVPGSGKDDPGYAVVSPSPADNTDVAVLLQPNVTAPTLASRRVQLSGAVGEPHPLRIVEVPVDAGTVFGQVDLRAPGSTVWVTLDVDANQTVRVTFADGPGGTPGVTYQLNHRTETDTDPPLPAAPDATGPRVGC